MKLRLLISSFLLCFSAMLFAEEGRVINEALFKKISKTHAIHRDKVVSKYLDGLIVGKGEIKSIGVKPLFKRKYRIIIEQKGSGQMKFIYHVFLNDGITIDLLNKNDFFEFKGKVVGITPIDTGRKIYIIDVLFREGSRIIN